MHRLADSLLLKIGSFKHEDKTKVDGCAWKQWEIEEISLDLGVWMGIWWCLWALKWGWANSQGRWLEETTWDVLALTLETNMMTQYVGNKKILISKWIYIRGDTSIYTVRHLQICRSKTLKTSTTLAWSPRQKSSPLGGGQMATNIGESYPFLEDHVAIIYEKFSLVRAWHMAIVTPLSRCHKYFWNFQDFQKKSNTILFR